MPTQIKKINNLGQSTKIKFLASAQIKLLADVNARVAVCKIIAVSKQFQPTISFLVKDICKGKKTFFFKQPRWERMSWNKFTTKKTNETS